MEVKRASPLLHCARALCLAVAPCLCAPAADVVVECQLLYEIADGIYVSAGRGSGLEPGGAGWLLRNGQQVARIEVVNVSRDSSFLRISGPRPKDLPAAGEAVTIVVGESAKVDPPKPRTPSATLKDRNAADEAGAVPLPQGDVDAPPIPGDSRPGQLPPRTAEGASPSTPAGEKPSTPEQEEKPLVPLLAPEGTAIGAFTDAYNISQGQVSIRQLFQFTPGKDLNYSTTRIRSSGSLERIEATPWVFEWSADLAYRDGKALEDVHNFREPRLDLYRLAVFRKFEDQSWVRIGRFLPRELPSVGYFDGAQGEWVLSKQVRVGGMFGFKPLRYGLDFSVNEPTQSGYVTLSLGEGENVSYMGTIGMLASMYKGKLDRMAFLADQTLHLERLMVFSSSELDFDVGGTENRPGTRLTRWDLVASYPLYSHTTVRGGLDRYERPDTAAERDTVPTIVLDDEEFFDRGYWRYWVGASHDLPWSLRLSEEISLTDAPEDSWTPRWHLALTRTGLPALPPYSSLTLSVFNLNGNDLDGYGGRLSSHIPFASHRFSLQPEVAFRFLESDHLGREDFFFTDVALRAHWTINKSWTLSGGASYAFTDDEDLQRVLFDFGVTFRW